MFDTLFNIDSIGLPLATVIATGLVLLLKALFTFARSITGKTPTSVDDKIVDEVEETFKSKVKDL